MRRESPGTAPQVSGGRGEARSRGRGGGGGGYRRRCGTRIASPWCWPQTAPGPGYKKVRVHAKTALKTTSKCYSSGEVKVEETLEFSFDNGSGGAITERSATLLWQGLHVAVSVSGAAIIGPARAIVARRPFTVDMWKRADACRVGATTASDAYLTVIANLVGPLHSVVRALCSL